jgi:REG-2-like HAD superfamily hydrolase
MRHYDVVVFDAAGTLIGRESPHYFEEFFVLAGRELGHDVPLERIKAALARRFEQPANRLSRGRMSTPDQARQFWIDLYAGVLREAGVAGDLREGLEGFYDRFQEGHFLEVYSDVRPTLDLLRRHGVRMGVLSNWSEHLGGILDRLGLGAYFAFLVVSAEVGCEKPDGRIFDMAVSRAGAPHNRILYVGDHPEEDIQPAQQIGVDALLIDRYDRHGRFRLPSIRRLTEVAAYVGISAPP